MVDTVRTLSALQALLADNTAGDISAQDMRDLLVSVYAQYSEVTRTSSFQTLTSGSEAIVTWETEVVDQLGMVDLGTSDTLLTCQTGGLYLFQYALQFAGESSFLDNQTNVRQTRLSVNGNPATFDNVLGPVRVPATGTFTIVSGSALRALNATDTIQLNVVQTSGESLAINGQRLVVARLSGAS